MATAKKTAPPSSTVILMVRHGQTPTTGKILPGRAAGLHLAEAGVAQAHRVAERIAELPKIDAIYASPLERARETAAPIAKALIGKKLGDTVIWQRPAGNISLEIIKISHIRPFDDTGVSSEKDCDIAIEDNYDFFDKNKIKVGDKVEIIQEKESTLIKFLN
jgi:bisphosphoglycerate-dependent phosphoglycerate mutase